jgi:hypothetical protein
VSHIDDVMRAAAPGARVAWSGRPTGWPVWSEGVRDMVRLAPGGLLALWMATCGPWSSVVPLPQLATLGAVVGALMIVACALEDLVRARRLEVRVALDGLFVARGAHVARLSLPACRPRVHEGSLWLGEVEIERLARDGRVLERGRDHVALPLGRSAASVAELLGRLCRDPETTVAPPAPDPRTLLQRAGSIAMFLALGVFAVCLVLPAATAVVALLLGVVLLGGAGDALARWPWRRGARRAWVASHPPVRALALAAELDAHPAVVDEVRAWLAEGRVPAERLGADDRLDALRALGDGAMTHPTIFMPILRHEGACATVGELIRKVEATLAAGPKLVVDGHRLVP